MAENAFVRILIALLKHQVNRLIGEEALGAIGEELATMGGEKLDEKMRSWLSEKTTTEELEKVALYANDCFAGKMGDPTLEQWMHELPLANLPKVLQAIEELPTSPDEGKLQDALRESIALNWKQLSQEQVV